MATTKKKVAIKPNKAAAKSKTTVSSKSNKKPAAKPAKSATKKVAVKKSATKKAVVKKAPVKPSSSKSTKKSAKPIVKKAAKKPAPKASNKLTKKTTPKNVTPVKVVSEKKSSTKKESPVAKAASKKDHKEPSTTPQPTHQELLKKAVKAKKVEDKKKAEKEKTFKMPEISTNRSRKYSPSFTRSILDQPEEKPSGPTLRYSDSELQEFKDLILRKLEAAKKELAYLQGLITRKDQMGGDDSDNRYMTMEDGSLSMEREQLAQMASRQITFIDHLEKALMRIENKTYGICRVTGKLIDKARLRAVPHATLSIEAKMGIAK